MRQSRQHGSGLVPAAPHRRLLFLLLAALFTVPVTSSGEPRRSLARAEQSPPRQTSLRPTAPLETTTSPAGSALPEAHPGPRDVFTWVVLIPGSAERREAARKVLAGLTLALDPLPEKEVSLCQLPSGKPHRLDTLKDTWQRLRDSLLSDHPLMVGAHFPVELRVTWRSAAGSERRCELHLRFADEERTHAEPFSTCPRCGFPDLVLGPVTSDAAQRIIKQSDESKLPPIPVITATATAATLEPDAKHASEEWRGRDYFYRFITPDSRSAARLSNEVVEGVRPRRIGLLYQDKAYGMALSDFFWRRLHDVHGGPEVLPPVAYPLGLFQGFEAAVNEGDIDCPICQVKKDRSNKSGSTPASVTPEQRAQPARLDTVFRWFRAMDVDAVGIFGPTRDKKAMLPKLRRYLPGALVFTTDADLDLEDFHCAEGLLIASSLDPRGGAQGQTLLSAFSGLAVEDVEPDVYLLQVQQAAVFLLKLVEEAPEATARTLLLQLRAHRGRTRTLAAAVADEVRFEANGDLMGRYPHPWPLWQRTADDPERSTRLLVIKHRRLTSLDSRVPRSAFDPGSMKNPFMHYGALFSLFGVFGVFGLARPLVGFLLAGWGGSWNGRAIATSGSPALARAAEAARPWAWLKPALSRWRQPGGLKSALVLRRRNLSEGALPLLLHERLFPFLERWHLPHFLAAGTLSSLFFIVPALWEGREPFTLLPNEFSAYPTVLSDCLVAGFSLWCLSGTMRTLEQVRQSFIDWDLKNLSAEMTRSAERLFWYSLPELIVATALLAPIVWGEREAGLPITGSETRAAYMRVSIGTTVVFAYAIWFVNQCRRLAAELAAKAHQMDDLALLQRQFAVVLEPFVDITFTGAIVFAVIVISRSRFFDHWEWSPWFLVFYSLVAALLLWGLYDVQHGWHEALNRARARLLIRCSNGLLPPDVQRRAVEQLGAASALFWDPRGSVKVIAALATPLAVTLIDQNKVALELFRSLSKLLGFG